MKLTKVLEGPAACKGLLALALVQVAFLVVRLAGPSVEDEPEGRSVAVSAARAIPQRGSAVRPSDLGGEPPRTARGPGDPTELRGQVLGAEGPLADAVVFVRAEGAVGGEEVRCDRQGRFHVTGLDPRVAHALTTRAAGHRTDHRVVRTPVVDLAIRMRPGEGLVGWVDGPDGRGLEGVAVFAVDSRGQTVQALSDHAGRFELAPPTGGTLSFLFVKRGYEVLRTGRLPIPPPGSDLERMQLRAGVTFRGRVVDARSQEGVEDARLAVSSVQMLAPEDPRRDVYPEPVTTDGRGEFTIPGLPESRVLLTIEATGYATRVEVCEVASDAPQTFALERGRTIEGVVRTTDGRPVPGVDVVVLRRTRIGTVSRVGHPVRTEGDGTFRFSSLPGDEPLVLHVIRHGSVAARSEELVPGAGGPERVELVVD